SGAPIHGDQRRLSAADRKLRGLRGYREQTPVSDALPLQYVRSWMPDGSPSIPTICTLPWNEKTVEPSRDRVNIGLPGCVGTLNEIIPAGASFVYVLPPISIFNWPGAVKKASSSMLFSATPPVTAAVWVCAETVA